MTSSEALHRHREEIRRIVESGNATNPRVFGSVLYGRDTGASDLDILVDPTQQTKMFDIGTVRYRLRDLLGVSVDALAPKALHENMRDAVLSEAQPIWRAGRRGGSGQRHDEEESSPSG